MKENNINMDRNIIVADSAGFCFGVERAVKILNETVEDGEKPIYTYGPIIHNEHVVKSFEEKGVRLYPVDEESAAGASSVESKDTQDSTKHECQRKASDITITELIQRNTGYQGRHL